MTVCRGVTTFFDNFDRAQAFTTTSGQNGWTIADTSSAGTPTYLCATENGGGCALTLDNTSEAQNVCLYHGDVLQFDAAELQHFWCIAKVSGIDAVTTLVMGMGSARNDTPDTVAESIWFRMEGSDSTTAVVAEFDGGTGGTTSDDVATGETLAAVYKKFHIDFTNGISDIRMFIDGARVADSTTFTLSGITAGQNLQPIIQIQKASGTGTPAVSIAQVGIQYSWAYGA